MPCIMLDEIETLYANNVNDASGRQRRPSLHLPRHNTQVAVNALALGQLLCQYVKEPTRKSNIVDLSLMDNPNFTLKIECEDL